jgi:signal transduction histidine kinase
MKLATKLVFFLVLSVIVVLAVEGYLTVERERSIFETNVRRDERLLGYAVRSLLLDTWNTKGKVYAKRLIQDANRAQKQIRIRWVWLDAEPTESDRPRVSPGKLAGARRGRTTSIKLHPADKDGYLVTYVPVEVDDRRPGAIELSKSLGSLKRRIEYERNRVVVLTLMISLFGAIVVVILGLRMVGRPLRELTQKARRMGKGDLSGPVVIRGSDELSKLADEMNRMCEKLDESQRRVRDETERRIAALEQLRHTDRLKTVGTLASGIAHEIGTPLNVISGRANLIVSGERADSKAARNAGIIKTQADRITNIIQQLLDFSRLRQPKRGRVDLEQVALRTIEMLDLLARKRGVEVSLLESGVDATVSGDEGQIQQVLTNLVVNAIHASAEKPGGRVELGLRLEAAPAPSDRHGKPAAHLCLSVKDTGPGIPGETMDRIFEPFFTTKDVGEGSGLGLSVARGIVEEHGGWIDVQTEIGRGSCFSVYFPQENGPWTDESSSSTTT